MLSVSDGITFSKDPDIFGQLWLKRRFLVYLFVFFLQLCNLHFCHLEPSLWLCHFGRLLHLLKITKDPFKTQVAVHGLGLACQASLLSWSCSSASCLKRINLTFGCRVDCVHTNKWGIFCYVSVKQRKIDIAIFVGLIFPKTCFNLLPLL